MCIQSSIQRVYRIVKIWWKWKSGGEMADKIVNFHVIIMLMNTSSVAAICNNRAHAIR